MTDVILFSEDLLLEQAARKVIAVENPSLNISSVMGRRGFSYFRDRVPQIQRSSAQLKFLVFLDGDELGKTCPSDAINSWFGSGCPRNIFVRFAFHEVESWLLSDRENMAAFLKVPTSRIPAANDDVRNTKELLVQLARRSKDRSIVQDLVPPAGFTSVVGPGYNVRITEFIRSNWDVQAAATQNESLARACRRVSKI